MMLRTRREMTRGTLMEEDSLTTGWLTGAPRSLSCRTSPLFPLSLGRRKASEVQHLASRPSMARNFRSLVGWLGLLLSPGKPPSDQIWPCLVFPCWLAGWLAGWLERLWLWLAGWRLWLAGWLTRTKETKGQRVEVPLARHSSGHFVFLDFT